VSIYTIVLFLHVVGDIGLFTGLGIQFFGLAALRKIKQIEQARIMARLIAVANPIGVISALLTIGTGLYMARIAWSLQTGWIIVALTSIIVILSPIIGLVIEPRMKEIVVETKKDSHGPLNETYFTKVNDPFLSIAMQTMGALLLGIVFLMTNKPSLSGAILTIAIALVAGLASGIPLWWGWIGRMKSRSDSVH
jgi:uncharacterized membrane protein